MSSVFLFGHGLSLEEYFSCPITFFALFFILSFGDGGVGRPIRLLLLFGFGVFYSHAVLLLWLSYMVSS